MSHPLPRHEPEVIEAIARARWAGDIAKVPTTKYVSIRAHGAAITSRFGRPGELETMAAMLAGVAPALRSHITHVGCDSRVTANYQVQVSQATDAMAREIASQMEAVCFHREGGHNGIVVILAPQKRFEIGADWSGGQIA